MANESKKCLLICDQNDEDNQDDSNLPTNILFIVWFAILSTHGLGNVRSYKSFNYRLVN